MKKLYGRILILFLCFSIFCLSPDSLKASLNGKVNYGKPLLKVIFLDVWQGDSFLIVTPSGKIALIDAGLGGSEYMRFDAGKMVILPYIKDHNIKKIDYLVMSHPHSDHIGGLPYLMSKEPVRVAYDCGMPYTSQLYMNCLEIISEKKLKYIIPLAPTKLKWDPLLDISVVHPPKDWQYSDNPNNNSIVMKMVYNKVSFLFTGDAEDEVEYSIVNSKYKIESTILKVAHHGSDTSSSDAFIDAVNPEIAIISVGKNNKFGHPSPSTIARYRERGIKIYRTDYDGHITVITDGEKYEISTQRKR